MSAAPKAYSTLFPVVQKLESQTAPLFQAEIRKQPTFAEGDPNQEQIKDALAERQARAAIALFRMGQTSELVPLLIHSPDPRLRSYILNWLEPLGAEPSKIAGVFESINPLARPIEADPPERMKTVLFHPETSQRRVLILALGTFATTAWQAAELETLTSKLLELYRTDPDAGIHGAAAWTLKQFGKAEDVKQVDGELAQQKPQPGQRWFVNGQRQTFTLVDAPVQFMIGSPESEPGRSSDETQQEADLIKPFAMATLEVTVAQYQKFVRSDSKYQEFGISQKTIDLCSPSTDGGSPMISVSWYGAAAYCNWLSKAEGIPEDQWCYQPNSEGKYDEGMTMVADVSTKTGYRLPTEEEWEFSCRAGTVTSRFYGQAGALLGRYAWFQDNGQLHAWPGGSLFPNELGASDMLGNVYEWILDASGGDTDQDINIRIMGNQWRLFRGGTYDDHPSVRFRSANRNNTEPSNWHWYGGFRLARTYP